MGDVQEIIDKLRINDFSNRDLEQYLESSLMLVKTNAIIAVLRKNITEESVVLKLKKISKNIQQEPKVIGEWNTGHYAMAVLYLLNTMRTREIYNDNMKNLDKYVQDGIKKLIEQIPYMLK
ncbi:MAG: hypothetical protein IJZ44_01840 [Lachnospiraceae bacterium]|nr:hypothetical protein [Lachnospiraceae bacterium]